MKNYIFCIASAIVYILLLVVFIRKAIHIFKNPGKYNEIKGWKEYRESKWYEPIEVSVRYSRSLKSRRHRAHVFVLFPMNLSLTMLYVSIAFLIQKYMLIPKGAIYLEYYGIFYGSIAAFILAAIICEWICFRSTKPVLIACATEAFNGSSRWDDWKRLVIAMIISSVICIPVMCAGTNSYVYATDKKISINKMLSIEEKDVFYSHIRYARTSYRTNKDGTEYHFSYEIVTEKDESIDLLSICSNKNILNVQTYLQNSNVEIIKTKLDNEVYHDMKKRVNRKEKELIDELFEIQ